MSRRTPSLLVLALAAFALSSAACAESTAPQTDSLLRAEGTCDQTSNNTCH